MRSKISSISRFVSRRPWQMAARPQDSHRKSARSSSDPTPLSPAAIRGVSYHRPFGPSKSIRVVVLASGQFHRRRDPHACCSSLTGDGCVICESHGYRARRSFGAAEERIGKGSGRWGEPPRTGRSSRQRLGRRSRRTGLVPREQVGGVFWPTVND